MKASGIYRIMNTVNGKGYVGSAVNMEKRLYSHHRSELRGGVHANGKLQAAWKKYGEPAFRFEVLLVCSKENLIMYEQRAIDMYGAVRNGYNICPTAGSQFGRRWKLPPEQSKAKSERMKGRKLTLEHRAKISAAKLGVPLSPEHAAKTRAMNIGRKHSAASRANYSASKIGRVFSEATRRKISEAQIGVPKRKHTPEEKARRAEWMRRIWAERKAAAEPVVEPKGRAPEGMSFQK